MSMDVFRYLVAVVVAIAAAQFIRRGYAAGSGRVRRGLTAGAFLLLGVAVLIVIFG